MTATADLPVHPPLRRPSVLVAGYERYLARTAAGLAAAAVPAGAVAPRSAAAVVAPPAAVAPAAAPAPVPAVDPAAELARAWELFTADTLPPGGKLDVALRISALTAGEPVPETVGTAAGREQFAERVQAQLDQAADLREKGRLAGILSTLRRGSLPSPEAGLSREAIEARNASLLKEIEATACPRAKYRLVGLMIR